jgi:uncharacterized protein (DUF305 family)
MHRPSHFPSARTTGVLVTVAVLATLLTRAPGRAEAHEMAAPPPGSAPPTRPGGDTFPSMMDDAMRRMDAGMNAPSTGDPDRDFARMMIPHHEGAVDMALAELRFGRDERLRRLAQGIIVEQRQEIALMRSILDGPPPAAASKRSSASK